MNIPQYEKFEELAEGIRLEYIKQLTKFLKEHNVEAIIWNEGNGEINDRYEIELNHIATLIVDEFRLKAY